MDRLFLVGLSLSLVTTLLVGGLLWFHLSRFVGYHRHKGVAVPRLSIHLALDELVAIARVAWWHVRALLSDGLRTPPDSQGRPVVCVHGYSQNATNLWAIRRALETLGRPTLGISLWHRLAPMGWYARRLEARLEQLAGGLDEGFGEGFDVVAHSMGGIVLRMVLARRPDLRRSIHAVVTLGTPHQGTAAVRGLAWLPELRALSRRSDLLAELPLLRELLPHARLVTVGSTGDTIVYPVGSTLEPYTENVLLHGIGHAGLLTHERALATVCRALSTDPPGRR